VIRRFPPRGGKEKSRGGAMGDQESLEASLKQWRTSINFGKRISYDPKRNQVGKGKRIIWGKKREERVASGEKKLSTEIRGRDRLFTTEKNPPSRGKKKMKSQKSPPPEGGMPFNEMKGGLPRPGV